MPRNTRNSSRSLVPCQLSTTNPIPTRGSTRGRGRPRGSGGASLPSTSYSQQQPSPSSGSSLLTSNEPVSTVFNEQTESQMTSMMNQLVGVIRAEFQRSAASTTSTTSMPQAVAQLSTVPIPTALPPRNSGYVWCACVLSVSLVFVAVTDGLSVSGLTGVAIVGAAIYHFSISYIHIYNLS